MKVLFVNHTSIKSGAEGSLLELAAGMPDEVSSVVACPEGDLADTLRGLGVTVAAIPEIDASFRLHPVQTLLGVAQIVRSAWAVRRAARRSGADLVHANSVRAGLVAALAARLNGPPLIVHVRDCLPVSRTADAARRLITGSATKVLAISRYTAENFRRGRSDRRVEIVYDAVDLDRFDPDRLDRSRARERLGIGSDVPLLGIVGQITPWKGHTTAIEALAELKQRIPGLRLLIVGSVKFSSTATRYDNASYLQSLREMVDRLQLHQEVMFLGEREDVPEIVRALDLVLVPSWEEPFGRTVIEAMAVGTPVVASCIGGPAEVIDDHVNGRLLPPDRPQVWAEVIGELIASPELREEMGEHGRRTAKGFGLGIQVERVLAAYREALGMPAGSWRRSSSAALHNRLQ